MESPPSLYASRREIPFTVKGLKIYCSIIGDPNAPKRIGHGMGFKSRMFDIEQSLFRLTDPDTCIISIKLPNTFRNINFINTYNDVVKAFFFSEQSPLFQHGQAPDKIVGLTHSTSGLLVEENLLYPKNNAFAADRFHGFVHLAPFFDLANASRQYDGMLKSVYGLYAANFPDVFLGDGLCDKAFLAITGQSCPFTSSRRKPTHGQTLEIRNFAWEYQELLETIIQNEDEARISQLPRHIIIGDADTVSCPKTAQWFCDHIPSASIEVTPGASHYLLSQEKEVPARVREAITFMETGRPLITRPPIPRTSPRSQILDPTLAYGVV